MKQSRIEKAAREVAALHKTEPLVRDMQLALEKLANVITWTDSRLPKALKVTPAPKAIRSWLTESGRTEAQGREYILEQLGFYEGIQSKACDERYWIALKLSCKAREAEQLISWARAGK